MKPPKDAYPPSPPHYAPNLGPSRAPFTSSEVYMSTQPIAFQGWVLKKRRKKMQGFARRYFTLYESGILSYAFEPGQPVRDQITLSSAAISTAPGRKDIHIDSNTATFHLKCLSQEDFDKWMLSLRKFISNGVEARRSLAYRHTSRQASINITFNRNNVLLEELGKSVAELEDAIVNCIEQTASKSAPTLKKSEKSSKDSKFGIFKRREHLSMRRTNFEPSLTIPPAHLQQSGSNGTPSSDSSIDSAKEGPFTPSLQDVKVKFDSLKEKYESLVKAMYVSLDAGQQVLAPLPFTVEEEETSPSHELRANTPNARRSIRDSMTTTSGSFVEWFDAEEGGPQEFIMDYAQDASEPASRIVSTTIESTADSSSVDTDFEDDDATPLEAPTAQDTSSGLLQVVRRTHLPCPAPPDEGSLFAILKKNVGRDLSTITFPVTFNEPLTLLQRAAEEVEYASLLDEAAKAEDPVTRFAYVAAFAVSGYGHTVHRTGRKGFNPLLAETFEDVRMKFIAEKVCHNPVEIAYHAEGEKWDLNVTSCGKTKFWGKSLEVVPLGTNRLRIGKDVYVWKKPSSFMRNLMVGTKYFEHSGKLTIENITTHLRCSLDFKQNGYWGPTNIVNGTVHDEYDRAVGQLDGKWDDQMCQILEASTLRVLWKINPFPKHTPESYGFTSFGITLNEITSDIADKLPPTDSRLRPDVRALEEADLDLAEAEKLRLEQTQRDRRNAGEERMPRWFKKVGDEWEYIGGYWESRARGWRNTDIKPLW